MAATITAADAILEEIDVARIHPNPDNPRTHFRQGELDKLLDSIREYGVQVPISVYRDGRKFILIDGERRWKCSLKLGKKRIAALVQPKPSPLQNLLLMYNIHALREQWDLLTIALKLPIIIDMVTADRGARPNERELAALTGLTRAIIRRCNYLLYLPEKYRAVILAELEKPKHLQKFTEDFFIEMERALTTVQRNMPELIHDERERDNIRRVLIEKYKKDIIPNRVHFRKIAKIARAHRVSANRIRAKEVLEQLFERNDYSAENAYDDSVSDAYLERDVVTRIDSLLERLDDLTPDDIDDDVRAHLRDLIARARALLGLAE